MNAAWLTAAAALAMAMATALGFAGRWTWRTLARVRDFLDDWAGQPPRPGVGAHPGVMARLQSVESAVATVVAETQPNGGHSMRDIVHQTSRDLADVKDDVAAMRARVELFEANRETRDDWEGK